MQIPNKIDELSLLTQYNDICNRAMDLLIDNPNIPLPNKDVIHHELSNLSLQMLAIFLFRSGEQLDNFVDSATITPPDKKEEFLNHFKFFWDVLMPLNGEELSDFTIQTINKCSKLTDQINTALNNQENQ